MRHTGWYTGYFAIAQGFTIIGEFPDGPRSPLDLSPHRFPPPIARISSILKFVSAYGYLKNKSQFYLSVSESFVLFMGEPVVERCPEFIEG